MICEKYHTSPFEIRRVSFREFTLFVSRLNDHNARERAEFLKTHKKVMNKDGTHRWIKKVYASDDVHF